MREETHLKFHEWLAKVRPGRNSPEISRVANRESEANHMKCHEWLAIVRQFPRDTHEQRIQQMAYESVVRKSLSSYPHRPTTPPPPTQTTIEDCEVKTHRVLFRTTAPPGYI